MHFILRHRRNLMRHLLLIEGGEPQGGEGEPPAGQNTHGEGDNAKNTTTDNQILRVNMANIRRKIEENPGQPKYIFTEVGVGYRMREGD